MFSTYVFWAHLPASALSVPLWIPFLGNGPKENDQKKGSDFKNLSVTLSRSTKLAVIRFCEGVRIELLHVTAMSSAEIWSSKNYYCTGKGGNCIKKAGL